MKLSRYAFIGAIALAAAALCVVAPAAYAAAPSVADLAALVHYAPLAIGLAPALAPERKEEDVAAILKQIGDTAEKTATAFAEFKETHAREIKEAKKAASDVLTSDKITRISDSLDQLVEAKNALEAKVKAEAKEREELETKFNRLGLRADSEGEAKAAVYLHEFNGALSGLAASRKKSFTPLDREGYDAYRAAHVKFMREGMDALDAAERKTLSVGSDPDGGYFVTPDTTGRIVKKVFETSPVRQYASVQSISSDKLEGVEDLGEAGVGYAGEHSTSGDTTTPQVGEWSIPVFWIDTEPKVTQQLLDDANVDIEAWLADKVSGKFGRFENREFVRGAANKIRGFVLGYDVAADSGAGVEWGKLGYVATGVSGDFAASAKGDKLYDLMGMLKSEYLAGAAWFANRGTITAIRKFKDGQNNYLWQPSFVAGQPETIMGYPVARMEDMPAMAADSYSLAFGDLKQAYQVVDRIGMRTLRDNLTSKPYVKFYTTKRVGGGVVNFEALKLMKFGTS